MYQIGENERVYKCDWMCQSFQRPGFSQLLMEMSIPLALYGLSTSVIIQITPMTMYFHTHIVYDYKNQCIFYPCPKVHSFLHATNIGKGIRIPLGAKYLSAFQKTFFILCKIHTLIFVFVSSNIK
jgi:hypothetical protein